MSFTDNCAVSVRRAENENPGALAGATGADIEVWLEWVDHNRNRESAARALARAVANCDQADRIPFLEIIIDVLRQGTPSVGFWPIMAEAREWAAWATRAELKAYCAACWLRLSPDDQAAFRNFTARRAAA